MCSDVLKCIQMFSDDHRCFWMFSGCSDGSCGPGGIWWLFQMKVWTLMIQRNSMILNYSMIPAIRWSSAIWWSPAIWWSIGSIDFDNPKVYGDTSITDGLVILKFRSEALHKQSGNDADWLHKRTSWLLWYRQSWEMAGMWLLQSSWK